MPLRCPVLPDSDLELTPLTALSPVDGRYHAYTGLRLRQLFSEYGLIHHRLEVEITWLLALAEHPEIKEIPTLSKAGCSRLTAIISEFTPKDAEQIKQIEQETNHDVKAIEYFLRGKLKGDKELALLENYVHFACTSWDINHPAYALMLDRARTEVLVPALTQLTETLHAMAKQYAGVPMLARTHGQPASPTTVGKELINTATRLDRQLEQLRATRFLAKMNGAVGNYNAHRIAYPDIDWPALSGEVLNSMGLDANPHTTQIEPYDQFAEFFHNLVRIHTVLIDFTRDAWQYISLGYFRQKTKSDEVGSSTMPHKVNPIDFENAEGNLGLANAELNHYAQKLPISRLQRDLSDSTVLRYMGATLGCSVNAYKALARGLDKLEIDEARLQADLMACPEVLSEALQTVMKRYGLPEPYEQLKAFTRGQTITPTQLIEFIDGLDLPKEVKRSLQILTPQDYLGYARELANSTER